ncbi:heat shock protein 30-like [Centruroides sculpturatus]|uniref:heat shock protein 30-like n=1 Tax=Centruroides sculpturatus TaxID=218467 RepID=UPI000C6DAE7C|nr:heat shock protein 30-like [Centruroides sculpturatus]XP_023232675.1 heat shock protein 30-like [Centruroides sculpturatus]
MALLSLWRKNNNVRHKCFKRCYPFSDLLADLQNELFFELENLYSLYSKDYVNKISLKRKCIESNVIIELDETKHYEPKELKIKMKGRQIEITGKHEEKYERKKNYAYREFRRVFQLPEDADPESVSSELTKDGLLRIRVSPLYKERSIHITVEKDNLKKSKCEKKDVNSEC